MFIVFLCKKINLLSAIIFIFQCSAPDSEAVFIKDAALESEVFRVYARGDVDVGAEYREVGPGVDRGLRATEPRTAIAGSLLSQQFSFRLLFGPTLSQSSGSSSSSSSLSTRSSSSSDSESSVGSILNLKRCFGTL